MSTQQDIYAAGSENRPPMLNKDNYVPWSSHLICYAKSDPDLEVPVAETFHEQTDDDLTEKEVKQMEPDDQAIQIILMGLPEDIYAVVDSCETAQEIWFTSTDGELIESYYHLDYTQLYDFLKYNHAEINELRAEPLARAHDPLVLMANSNNPYNYTMFHQDQPSPVTYMQQPQPNNNFIPQPSFNTNYMQQPMPNPEDITDPTTTMIMALVLIAKAFKLNYSTPTNNNKRFSSNPLNRLFRMQFRIRVIRMLETRMGLLLFQELLIRMRIRMGMLLIAQKEEAGIQLQAEEFYFMAVAGDLDKIEKVTTNCILMANLQQASTSGTQIDKPHVYDSDRSAEVHHSENCYNNDIFNMFTQEEQYTKLLEPIPELHQVQQNDNNVISEDSNMEQSGGTVEQNLATVEETRALYDSLYNNLAIKVEKLSKEKSTVSSLQEEKKKLKSDFKIREDELLDKQIQLENKIKELDNILVKMGQLIQTMHMLSPKPDSFYDTKQKMALGYQNPFLSQASWKSSIRKA
ncbi:hypothetical protein Tco_1069499 [Tanacetum coccineum]|uniref:Uncharacterized protein n=1 Tax=Tanacetum coccineum TaxID=301880 RepID=A0ABQ5HIQ0_9ASTR